MATYIALVDLDGNAVQVNAENVESITPVPAGLLPVGIPAGSYVEAGEETTRVAVQGTVAAVVALLGGFGGFAFAVINGATGAIVVSRGLTSSVRNGAGDYSLVWDAANMPGVALGGGFAAVEGTITQNQTGPNTTDIFTWNAAGAAADADQFTAIGVPVS